MCGKGHTESSGGSRHLVGEAALNRTGFLRLSFCASVIPEDAGVAGSGALSPGTEV